MHTDVRYNQFGDEAARRAINDWVSWLGLRRAKGLAYLAAGRPWMGNPAQEDLTGRWDMFNFACGFAGVSGFPVREAFKRFAHLTQEQLEAIPEREPEIKWVESGAPAQGESPTP